MKTDHEVIAEKNKEHLRQALGAGEYYTERDSLFYSRCNGVTLDGPCLMVPRGQSCRPIRSHEDRAILVRFTDPRKHQWFAWIHA